MAYSSHFISISYPTHSFNHGSVIKPSMLWSLLCCHLLLPFQRAKIAKRQDAKYQHCKYSTFISTLHDYFLVMSLCSQNCSMIKMYYSNIPLLFLEKFTWVPVSFHSISGPTLPLASFLQVITIPEEDVPGLAAGVGVYQLLLQEIQGAVVDIDWTL